MIHLVIKQVEKESLCWSSHLKLTRSLPSRGPEADQVSNSKLSHLLSTHHQAWFSNLYHKLVHQEMQQPPLPPPALPQPVVQQPASTPTALPQQVAQPTSMQQPSAEQASQPKPVRRRITQKGPGPAASKLHSILEKAGTIQEIELAVNASEEELRDSQEV